MLVLLGLVTRVRPELLKLRSSPALTAVVRGLLGVGCRLGRGDAQPQSVVLVLEGLVLLFPSAVFQPLDRLLFCDRVVMLLPSTSAVELHYPHHLRCRRSEWAQEAKACATGLLSAAPCRPSKLPSQIAAPREYETCRRSNHRTLSARPACGCMHT